MRYRNNGTPIEVLIKGLPIVINGKMAGAYGIYADITDRKRAEKSLTERESKYNAVFEGSHDSVTVLREDGRFIDCNQQTLEMFGVQSKEDFLMARPADFSPILQPNGKSSIELSQIYIADANEVMVNGRPYKKAMTTGEIAAEFQRCAGSHFDPALVDIFLPLSK